MHYRTIPRSVIMPKKKKSRKSQRTLKNERRQKYEKAVEKGDFAKIELGIQEKLEAMKGTSTCSSGENAENVVCRKSRSASSSSCVSQKQSCSTKKDLETGLSLIQNNSNDCLIVASHSQQAIEFSAVDHFWQGRMCNQFSLQLVHPLVASKTIAAAGQPKVIHQIRGDGNCFFRTISFVITGSENYHQDPPDPTSKAALPYRSRSLVRLSFVSEGNHMTDLIFGRAQQVL